MPDYEKLFFEDYCDREFGVAHRQWGGHMKMFSKTVALLTAVFGPVPNFNRSFVTSSVLKDSSDRDTHQEGMC